MPDVVMPRLSDSMEEGTILRWLVDDGSEVARGQEIVEIETDKATMSYEADVDGVLHVIATEGSTLPIGAVIATIGDANASASAAVPAAEPAHEAAEEAPVLDPAPVAAASAPATAASAGAAAPAPATGDGFDRGAAAQAAGDAAPSNGGERVKASPLARRIAGERDIDLHKLTGTGPAGRIVKADVLAALGSAAPSGPAAAHPSPPPAPPPVPVGSGAGAKGEVTEQELTRTQQVVARRMAESKATVPDFQVSTDVDMDACRDLRTQLRGAAGEGQVVPSFNDMVVKACALALREHPRANGSYRDGRFELHARVNVGVAVAGDDALVVPTVPDADTKSLGEIARTTRELAERVRENAIRPPELAGGTFTVSNLGMFGVTHFTAVVNPPQAAILAVGAIVEQPVVRDGQIVVGHVMTMTLSCDHRILYGADAARFLARVRELLEQPLALAF